MLRVYVHCLSYFFLEEMLWMRPVGFVPYFLLFCHSNSMSWHYGTYTRQDNTCYHVRQKSDNICNVGKRFVHGTRTVGSLNCRLQLLEQSVGKWVYHTRQWIPNISFLCNGGDRVWSTVSLYLLAPWHNKNCRPLYRSPSLLKYRWLRDATRNGCGGKECIQKGVYLSWTDDKEFL